MPNRPRVDTAAGHRLSLRRRYLVANTTTPIDGNATSALDSGETWRGENEHRHGERSGADREQQRRQVAKGIGVASFTCHGPTGKLFSEFELGWRIVSRSEFPAAPTAVCGAPSLDLDERHEQVHIQQQLNREADEHVQN